MAQDEITAPDIEIIFHRLNDGRSELNYQAYQTVYNQGDPANCVFYIKTGRAKVTIHSSEGKEAVVAILGRGDFCGEKCVAGYKLRRTTVRILTECILVRMAKTAIIRTLHDDNALFDLFISYLVKHTVQSRGGFGGPTTQLDRKAFGATSDKLGELWKGRLAVSDRTQG